MTSISAFRHCSVQGAQKTSMELYNLTKGCDTLKAKCVFSEYTSIFQGIVQLILRGVDSMLK